MVGENQVVSQDRCGEGFRRYKVFGSDELGFDMLLIIKGFGEVKVQSIMRMQLVNVEVRLLLSIFLFCLN